MAVPETARLKRLYTPLAALLLLAGFALATAGLTRDSLWADEAFTLWAVHDSARPPQGAADAARYLAASLGGALANARADVHPPLYFVLFDAWTLAAGATVFAARLFSALWLLLGAAATCALGARLFGRRAGLLAAALLLTAPLSVYYAREARMYTLLLALAALATLAYVRWRRRAVWPRGLAWGLLAAALLYTHYAGALVLVAQAGHALLARSRARVFAPLALAGALFVPWLPALLNQIQAHGSAAALPVDTLAGAAALALALTAGVWWLYALALLAGAGALRGRAALILLWLLLPPAALLALNNWLRAAFQLRYALAIVPAWALLLAGGLAPRPLTPIPGPSPAAAREGSRTRCEGAARPLSMPVERGLGGEVRPARANLLRAALALALIAAQLAAYDAIWPPKPRWDAAVGAAAAARDPLEPALAGLDPQSPAAYYDRLYGLTAGLALNIGWRWQEADAVRAQADRFAAAPRVWLLARSSRADAWDALFALLAQGRGVGYRDTVMDAVFYRFDRASAEPLRWRFGDLLDYTGGVGHRLYARAGEPLCFDLALAYRAAPPAGAELALTLTQGYDTVRAAAAVALPPGAAGAELALPACIAVPADSPAGPYHLRAQALVSGAPLPLLEAGALYWGETLFVALVSVE